MAPGIIGLSHHPVPISLYQSIRKMSHKWPAGRLVVYYVHGGGKIAGDRFFSVAEAMAHFSPADDVIFVSPEYRLAPEHPAPVGVIDMYLGLVYLVSHAKEFGIDSARIVLYECSGGAGIAASACLAARELNGHKVAALLLNIPMLD
ncbi:alpha beta domain protein, partial [Pyrenophora tritici-repentis]